MAKTNTADGDTIIRTRPYYKTSGYTYKGQFEMTTDGWIYHTGAGFYDLAHAKHYWCLRDRMGSTVAVIDANGNYHQTTAYYPSGTPYQLPNATLATSVDATTDRLHIGNKWMSHSGLNWYDNTARMHDPVLMHFASADPLYTKYPDFSPWSHCAANPVNLIDANGLEWRPKKDTNGYTSEYEWVEGEDARDKEGKLLPGVYEMAILFTAEGEGGKKLDTKSNSNIGSSIAIVYGAKGSKDIHKFNACTYPTDDKKYATVPAGDYEAMKGIHHGTKSSYEALRVGDRGTQNFNNNRIELGGPNPSDSLKTYATGINIHKAGINNYTGHDDRKTIISAGCLLIDINQWNKFINLFPKDTRIGITIQR